MAELVSMAQLQMLPAQYCIVSYPWKWHLFYLLDEGDCYCRIKRVNGEQEPSVWVPKHTVEKVRPRELCQLFEGDLVLDRTNSWRQELAIVFEDEGDFWLRGQYGDGPRPDPDQCLLVKPGFARKAAMKQKELAALRRVCKATSLPYSADSWFLTIVALADTAKGIEELVMQSEVREGRFRFVAPHTDAWHRWNYETYNALLRTPGLTVGQMRKMAFGFNKDNYFAQHLGKLVDDGYIPRSGPEVDYEKAVLFMPTTSFYKNGRPLSPWIRLEISGAIEVQVDVSWTCYLADTVLQTHAHHTPPYQIVPYERRSLRFYWQGRYVGYFQQFGEFQTNVVRLVAVRERMFAIL
jgi:hypothetical protein